MRARTRRRQHPSGLGLWVLGCRGLGFWGVGALGCWGFGFKVWGFKGLGFGVSGLGLRLVHVGIGVPDLSKLA